MDQKLEYLDLRFGRFTTRQIQIKMEIHFFITPILRNFSNCAVP